MSMKKDVEMDMKVTMGTKEIIRIENASKSFKSQSVLANTNISVSSGQAVGFVGRNGSGKTVLLKLICGLMYPEQGRVVVDGKELGRDVDFPENVGAIIEAPGFISYQSGLKNLLYLASLRNKITKDQVVAVMRIVGLDPNNRKHVGKFSLGMKQRLGIAQAIMENPSILVLDEPMNGLDKHGVKDVRNLLLDLKSRGVTLVLASHIQEDLDILCDTVYEIDDGKVRCLTDIEQK